MVSGEVIFPDARIWASTYVLRSHSLLGSRAARKERHGSLLKIETSEGVGYADIHPWPELGDLPLSQQLESLRRGRVTNLTARSLELACLDRRARASRVNVFGNNELPASHFLYDLAADAKRLDELRARGFRTLKVKLGRDLNLEKEQLSNLATEFEKFGIVFDLRLDFNSMLTADTFLSFVRSLPKTLRIEFVEDPCPWSATDWSRIHRECSLNLALDREGDRAKSELNLHADNCVDSFQWCVIKPAAQDPLVMGQWASTLGTYICVTSYLDHPVGQLGAALEAQNLIRAGFHIGTCGIVSHLSLEQTEWTEQLGTENARLIPPPGIGIGYGSLLEKQTWKRLR